MDHGDLLSRVGVYVDALDGVALDYLVSRGLSPEYIERYHLGFVDHGYYANSISIPYFTGTGALRALRFRRLDRLPKYDAPTGAKAHIFNVGSLRHRDICITEGEFDAIALEQLGYHAVGIPGAQLFDNSWRYLFAGNRVFIAFDPDDAGRKASRQLGRILDKTADHVERVEFPDGLDVSDLLTKEGPEAVRECLTSYES